MSQLCFFSMILFPDRVNNQTLCLHNVQIAIIITRVMIIINHSCGDHF